MVLRSADCRLAAAAPAVRRAEDAKKRAVTNIFFIVLSFHRSRD